MKYLIANWKMKLTVSESVALAREVLDELAKQPLTDVEVMLCPSFPALIPVGEVLKGNPVAVGAQDVAPVARASLTGAVSSLQLREAGVETVIIGHSERRKHFGETDQVVREKLAHVLAEGMRAILCVGENADERSRGDAAGVIRQQVSAAVEGVSDLKRLMIAYEPVWAIGTGVPVSVEDAGAQANEIREELQKRGYEKKAVDALPILYGGSVDKSTITLFSRMPLSGTLIGNASQTGESLRALIQALSNSAI